MKQFSTKIVALKVLYKDSFVIPEYQRLYEWGKDEIPELWQDLLLAAEQYKATGQDYFLGTMIICEDKRGLELIDGQQRSTALSMLLHIIKRDFLPNMEMVLPRIKVQRDIREIYKRVVLDKKSYAEFKNYAYRKTRKPTEMSMDNIITNRELRQDVEKRYMYALSYFYKQLTKLNEKNSGISVREFYDFVSKHTYFNIVKSREEQASIRIFQTLNMRGQALSDSAVFKSFIIGECADKIVLKNNFNKFWHDYVENFLVMATSESPEFSKYAKHLGFNADDCIHCYTYYKLGKIPRTKLAVTLRKVIEKEIAAGKGVSEVVREFKDFFLRIEKTLKEFPDEAVPLLYTPWKPYVVAILSLVAQLNEGQREVLLAVRRLFYINMINHKTAQTIRTPAINIIKKLGQKESSAEICTYINERISHADISACLKVLTGEVYKKDEFPEKFVKPVLLWLEFIESGKFYVADNTTDIDHIHAKVREDVEEELKYCFGNLSLLEDGLNKHVQEGDFAAKRPDVLHGVFRGEKMRYRPTKFKTTRDIYRLNKTWGAKEIQRRQKKMIAELRRLLEI